MKRGLDDYEISDGEWEDHSSSFKPSRVLNNKPPRAPPPPAIESFAYKRGRASDYDADFVFDISDDSDDDCVEIKDDLEDDDVEEVVRSRPVTRGRRFVVEDEDSDGDWAELESSSEEEEEVEEAVEDDDVVGRALQKCAKISADLKRELHGSSAAATASDRYAEVDASSVRIVTQVLFQFCPFR